MTSKTRLLVVAAMTLSLAMIGAAVFAFASNAAGLGFILVAITALAVLGGLQRHRAAAVPPGRRGAGWSGESEGSPRDSETEGRTLAQPSGRRATPGPCGTKLARESRRQSRTNMTGPRDDSAPSTAGAATLRGSYRGRRVLHWLGIVAIVVVGAAALRKLDVAELGRALARANAPLLLAATVVDLLALAAQAGRWLAIVHPVEPRATARNAFFTLVAGYAIGLVFPARASDLARAHLFSRLSCGSTATFAATAVVDHLLASLTLFIGVGVFAAVSPLPPSIRHAGTLACAVTIAVLVALWILRPKSSVHPDEADRSGQVPVSAFRAFVFRIQFGLLAVGKPRALLLSGLFAIVGWGTEILIAHLSLLAFGLPAGIETSVLAVLATTVAAAASVSPGNAGAFEIACVLALSGLGIASEPALAFAIGYHAVHLVPTAVIGGGWLLASGYKAAILREAP